MKFLTPEAWVEKYFDASSRPAETTVRRWMRIGAIPARKIGGAWYIDEARWAANGNLLVARVLKAG